LHGDRVYTPGNQYGANVLAYSVTVREFKLLKNYNFIENFCSQDLPSPFCKEARLTIVHMDESVPRTFYFIVSTPAGVAEDIIEVNFTTKHQSKRINSVASMNNNLPIFSSSADRSLTINSFISMVVVCKLIWTAML
jgi:hypothetical protein